MAGTELGKAYVQIVPSAKGIKGSISNILAGEATSAGNSAGQSFGGSLIGKVKGIIAAAGIGKLLASTISEGAALEQSLGGIDTLFKESAEKVKENAKNAFKTAGMSANEYMELATSFSASLLQSVANDTSKAADVADMAMTDMSDNANKMGTSMDLIQNAYQGFAKQNYTMLDNLKLGYGGTKTEMERLLADAQKITGVKYDINNLSDVYSAIHTIQGELGITGTTAKEAATTVSGSFGQMKAAASNLLGNLALGEDIAPSLMSLISTTSTFLLKNLLPMVGNIVKAIPDILSEAVTTYLPMAVQGATDFVSSFAQGFETEYPKLLETGNMILTNLLNGIWEAIPNLLMAAEELMGSFTSTFQETLPDRIENGKELLQNIMNGITENLPLVVESAKNILTNLLTTLCESAPTLLDGALEMIMMLVSGLVDNLPMIAESAIDIVFSLLQTLLKQAPKLIQSGIEFILKLLAGLIEAVPKLIAAIPDIIEKIKTKFSEIDWGKVGKDILDGIGKGIVNGGKVLLDAAKNAAKSALNAIKETLGIHSPSTVFRDQVGKMLPLGMAKGIIDNIEPITDAVDEMQRAVTKPMTLTTIPSILQYDLRYQNIPTQNDKTDTIITLLTILIEQTKNQKVMLNRREIMRILREEGVVFA